VGLAVGPRVGLGVGGGAVGLFVGRRDGRSSVGAGLFVGIVWGGSVSVGAVVIGAGEGVYGVVVGRSKSSGSKVP
jgi:hypothetical protein